jgi:hypothetical protein
LSPLQAAGGRQALPPRRVAAEAAGRQEGVAEAEAEAAGRQEGVAEAEAEAAAEAAAGRQEGVAEAAAAGVALQRVTGLSPM